MTRMLSPGPVSGRRERRDRAARQHLQAGRDGSPPKWKVSIAKATLAELLPSAEARAGAAQQRRIGQVR